METADSLDLLSPDMRRELQRQEWEKQAHEAINGPLHYSDVRFSEKREHGVGFFEFAKDEDTRQQQLEALKKLRQQTEEQRQKAERLKEKRKALMQTRLAKVKQRKTVLDLPDLDFDPLASEENLTTETPGTNVHTAQAEPNMQDGNAVKKITTVREWDRGKRFDETSWLADRRDERRNEFAPPPSYSGSMTSASKQRQPPVRHINSLSDASKASSVSSSDSVQTGPSLEEDIGMKLSAIRNTLTSNAQVSTNTTADVAAANQCESTTAAVNSDLNSVYWPHQLTGHATTGWNDSSTGWNGSTTGWNDSSSFNWSHTSATSSITHMYTDGLASSTAVGVSLGSINDVSASTEGGYVQAAEELEKTSFVDASKLIECSSSRHVDQVSFAAPQPVHYCSAPSLPQPKQPAYERVLLHELPATLPAPPTSGSAASLQYPSQEEIIGPRRKQERREMIDEQAAIKSWYRQFDKTWHASKTSSASSSSVVRDEVIKDQTANSPAAVVLKPRNIPFASPYIQAQETENVADRRAEEVKYDPSIPPPEVDS